MIRQGQARAPGQASTLGLSQAGSASCRRAPVAAASCSAGVRDAVTVTCRCQHRLSADMTAAAGSSSSCHHSSSSAVAITLLRLVC